MTTEELARQLGEFPRSWKVRATVKNSLEVWNPDGPEYAYIFMDGRPARRYTDRTWEAKHALSMRANGDHGQPQKESR